MMSTLAPKLKTRYSTALRILPPPWPSDAVANTALRATPLEERAAPPPPIATARRRMASSHRMPATALLLAACVAPAAGLKVLLFGANGNLGSTVLYQLSAAGHDVTCFVRLEQRLRAGFNDRIFDDVIVIEGDACDRAAVDRVMAAAVYDVVVSTAGYVDNGVRSEAEALATPFCRMFDNIAGAAEAHLPPPGRAIFTGGITALDVPGVEPPTAIQSLLTSRAPQYVAHQVNHARLERSKLDWTLLCPGYLVDAPGCDKSTGCEPGEEPLRLSVDTLPAFPPETRFRPWQLKRPLKYPFVLLPFRLREEEWTVPYESVAAVLVNHLEAGGGLSRARVGLANPPGVRLKKTQAARKRERKVRARAGRSTLG